MLDKEICGCYTCEGMKKEGIFRLEGRAGAMKARRCGREGMKEHIYLASPHMSEEGYEKEFIKEAFDTNGIAALGKNVTGLEKGIAEALGAKAAVALSSGTSAIHMALKSVGVEKGDVVFCQSLTFAATANPIVYEGASPVFIDSEESTWNMSPSALKRAFKKYSKMGKLPKAVIAVHLYGICASIDEIVDLCNEYGVPLIEDAAESLGTAYHGKYTGTFGDYGIISFNGNKIITTSGGGMILLNMEDAKERAAKVAFWSTQARDQARWYQHSEIGYNYRMSNIAAGIGCGQLKVLDQRIEKKREIFQEYQRRLGHLEGISFMPQNEWERSNCWLTVIQIADSCKVKPMDIQLALEADDVESRPVWKPLHLQPVFADSDFITEVEDLHLTEEETGADNSVAGTIFRRGVCLPSDTKMTEKDLSRICSVLAQLWKSAAGDGGLDRK